MDGERPSRSELEEIITTDFGEPVEEYVHPLSDEAVAAYEAQMEELGKAARPVPPLYCG